MVGSTPATPWLELGLRPKVGQGLWPGCSLERDTGEFHTGLLIFICQRTDSVGAVRSVEWGTDQPDTLWDVCAWGRFNRLAPDTVENVENGGSLSDHTPSKQLPFLQFETYPSKSSDRSRYLCIRVGAGRSQKKE